MAGTIATSKLKPHPKNTYYFTDISGDKYEEVKRSIEVNGIRDPIKCTTSFTVISGHQRLRIAKELGMSDIPVQILDVDEWEAEYLLIAENVERRGQAETDPIKKSRIATFLKEYWGVNYGGDRKSSLHNAHLKTTEDIAESIGESIHQTRRIMKLNDLIPEIQQLVSDGKLGTTAAEQYAHISEENQRALIEVLGEDLGKKSVGESKVIRKQAESSEDFEQKLRESEARAEELRAERDRAKEDAERARRELESVEPTIVEREVVKEVVPSGIEAKISQLEEGVRNKERLVREREDSIDRLSARISELEKLESIVEQRDDSPLRDFYVILRSVNNQARILIHETDKGRELVNAAPQELVDDIMTQVQIMEGYSETLVDLLSDKQSSFTMEKSNQIMIEGEI